jgi:agmatine deiminase
MPAEFEPMAEVILNWDPIFGPPPQAGDPDLDPDALTAGLNVLLAQVVKAIVDEGEAKAKISVYGPFEEMVVGGILAGSIPIPGVTPVVNLDRVQIVQTVPVTIWTRDHAPIGVIRGEGSAARVAYVDMPYYLGRPHDDMGPMWLGLEDGQPPLKQITRVKFEGGNLLTDGQGKAWATDIMLLDTAEYLGVDPRDEKELEKVDRQMRKELRKMLGIEDLTLLPSGLVDPTSYSFAEDDALGGTYHVDMGLKIVSADTVIVSRYADASASSQRANAVLDSWAEHFSDGGYRVFRVVSPPNDLVFGDFIEADGRSLVYTYANSLILNDIVIMPSYASAGYSSYDDAAEAVYAAALPSHTVVKVDASVLVPLSGSIHCITREIPAGQRLQGPLPAFEPRSSEFVVIGEATSEGQGVRLVAEGPQAPNPQPAAAYPAVIAEQMGLDVSFGDAEDDLDETDFILKDRGGHNWYFPGIYNVLSHDHERVLTDFALGTSLAFPPDDDTLRNRYLFPDQPPKNRLEQALALQPETLIIDIGEDEPTSFLLGNPAALSPQGVSAFYDQIFLALAYAPSPPQHVAVFTMSNDVGWIARGLESLEAVAPTSSPLFTAPFQALIQQQYDAHNAALRATVSAHGAAVVEMDELMQGLFSDSGITIGGRFFNLASAIEELLIVGVREDWLVGGVPTRVGSRLGFTPLMQKVIAYRAIETINAHYGTAIPLPCLQDGDLCEDEDSQIAPF